MHNPKALYKTAISIAAVMTGSLLSSCNKQQQTTETKAQQEIPTYFQKECVEDGYFHTTCADTADTLLYRPREDRQ